MGSVAEGRVEFRRVRGEKGASPVIFTLAGIIVLEVLTVAKSQQKDADRFIRRFIGRFIVVDPAICHGHPTFRGTRVLVADVLEQVAAGIAWETIVEEWRGDVSADAISEAVRGWC
jgi:uncharacterized protein (DUF433 family)